MSIRRGKLFRFFTCATRPRRSDATATGPTITVDPVGAGKQPTALRALAAVSPNPPRAHRELLT
jgi:hypothetical protein